MPIAVELTLDDKTSAHLKNLWREIQASGLENRTPRLDSHPHITLALYEDNHWDDLQTITEKFAERQPALNVAFDHIGIFNNRHKVLFLAPNVTHELLQLRDNWLTLAGHLPTWSKAAGADKGWAPHATLAKQLRDHQVQPALDFLMQAHLPQGATIIGVHLNQFSEPFASSFYGLSTPDSFG